MRTLFRPLFLLVVWTWFSQCSRPEIAETGGYPRLKTLPVSEITSAGATFHAEIIYRGEMEIVAHGFVWDTDPEPTLENSERMIRTGSPSAETFADTMITTNLKERTPYFVRAYIQTVDYLVYGAPVEFMRGSPLITSVSPTEAGFCDTVYVRGANFGVVPDQNELVFGTQQVPVLYASDTLLKALIPDDIDTSSFKVELHVQRRIARAPENIRLKRPVISLVAPSTVMMGDTITIMGEHFAKSNSTNTVRMNGKLARVLSSACNTLQAVVPIAFGPLNVTVSTLPPLRAMLTPSTVSYLRYYDSPLTKATSEMK